MCGIVGLIFTSPRDKVAERASAMLSRLKHRGPDDHGWLCYSRSVKRAGRGELPFVPMEAVMLHRRLSILDLSEAGWQPMSTPDGRYAIVYNGEIYNYLEVRVELERRGHVFDSRSDTEVLLHAYVEWGPYALQRLVGMFAFGILDMQARRLFLARDHAGIKPLYYVSLANGFAFASEIKALLELPEVDRQVNPQRLYDYLRFGLTDHGGETLFARVRQLPSAHYLEVALDHPADLQPVCYWSIDLTQRQEVSFEKAAQHLRDLFLESVRLHMRSDVPVGAALSGGIDSSSIVMTMRHLLGSRLDLHTFSYIADEPSRSEERWVDRVGRAAGAIVHKVCPNPQDLVTELDDLIAAQDEPFGSTSIYAQRRVFRLAGDAGIKVMLDGQGADELLGGYRLYLPARLASLMRQGQWGKALRFLPNALGQTDSGGARLVFQAGGLLLPRSLHEPAMRLVGENLTPSWLNANWFWERGVIRRSFWKSNGRQLLRDQLHRTVVETSLPMLLRYEDRNSMSFSIESRVPFLTPALINFCLTLPEEYIISDDGTSKAVFRQAMRGIVPDAILDRRDKIGFATPEESWLTFQRPWVDRVLRSETARRVHSLNLEAVMREWHAIVDQGKRFDFRVWRWINTIRWAERYQVSFTD